MLTPAVLRQLAAMRQRQIAASGGYSQPVVRRVRRQRGAIAGTSAVNAVWLNKSPGKNGGAGGMGKLGSRVKDGVLSLTVPLSQILASCTTDGSGNYAYNVVVAPGNLSSRNGQFAGIFEQAHIDSVALRWVPTASAGDPGSIISCVDYNNAAGSFPTTLILASQREKQEPHSVWVPWVHPVKFRPSDRTAFVNSSSTTSHRSDGFAYAIGFVCEGAHVSTLIGHICADIVVTYSGLKAV